MSLITISVEELNYLLITRWCVLSYLSITLNRYPYYTWKDGAVWWSWGSWKKSKKKNWKFCGNSSSVCGSVVENNYWFTEKSPTTAVYYGLQGCRQLTDGQEPTGFSLVPERRQFVLVTHDHKYRGISGDILMGLDCSFVIYLEPNFYPWASRSWSFV